MEQNSHMETAIISCNAQTKADAQTVWHLLTDVGNWKKWDDDLRDVKFSPGSFNIDTVGEFVGENGGRSHFRVTECKSDFTYTLETRLPFTHVYTRRMLGYHNNKTIITHEVWMEGPLRGFWSFLLGSKYEKKMRKLNARLVELAEQ